MVHHRRRRRRAFHPDRAHLGRCAPGPHRVPVSQGPARLAHRAPHRDHGTGGARRPLRARIRRPRSRRRERADAGRRRPAGRRRFGSGRRGSPIACAGSAWPSAAWRSRRTTSNNREGFGIKLADRESVQIKLGEVAQQIQIGRLLTMHAAWKLDQGDRARKEVSMAKVQVADTLHKAADVAIQLNGARGYLQGHDPGMDLPLCPLGAPRRRRLGGAQDGAGPLHARGRPRFLVLGRRQSMKY